MRNFPESLRPRLLLDAAALREQCESHFLAAEKELEGLLLPKEERTQENTLRPFDLAWWNLHRASSFSALLAQSHPDPEIKVLAETLHARASRKLGELFAQPACYQALEIISGDSLDPLTARCQELYLRDFQRQGVHLEQKACEEHARLDGEIARLSSLYQRNLDEEPRELFFSKEELEGVPDFFFEKHPPGKNGNISIRDRFADWGPVLRFAQNEQVRIQVKELVERAGNPRNEEVLTELLEARRRKAELLGYPSFLAYILEQQMLQRADVLEDFLDSLAEVVEEPARKEAKMLLEEKASLSPDSEILGSWDISFLSHRVQQKRYSLNKSLLRDFFPLEQSLQGLFDLVQELFGLEFRESFETPVWHESVRSFEVWEKRKRVGRFFLDAFHRMGKTDLPVHFAIQMGRFGECLPESALLCNFSEGHLEHGDVVTLFHEFGHLLHHLLSGGTAWARLGDRGPMDFIELPSILMEEWAWDPESLQRFARHSETGEPISAGLLQKLKSFQQFGMALFLGSEIGKLKFSAQAHAVDPRETDLGKLFLELEAPHHPCKRTSAASPHLNFRHITGMSALFYTYPWSKLLALNVLEEFQREGMLNPVMGQRYKQEILSKGCQLPAMEQVRNVLGKEMQPGLLWSWLRSSQ